MSGADLAIIAIAIFGAYRGYRQGFVVELFSLVGVILGILGGFKLMGITLVLLSDQFEIDKNILPYVAFAVVFLIIVICVSLLGRLLRRSIDKSFLGRIDEVVGAVLGLVKTVFMISVALWIFTSIRSELMTSWTEDSALAPYVGDFAPWVTSYIGELIPSFRDIF